MLCLPVYDLDFLKIIFVLFLFLGQGPPVAPPEEAAGPLLRRGPPAQVHQGGGHSRKSADATGDKTRFPNKYLYFKKEKEIGVHATRYLFL